MRSHQRWDSAQILLTQGLDPGDQSTALVACGEVFPAPLTDDDDTEQLEQAGHNRQQIDGVENALDQDLSNDHRGEDADHLADASGLAPVDFVEGFVHLAENVLVAFGKIDGVSATGGLGRLSGGFVAHDALAWI